jgi:hypothetical protein
MFIPRHFVSLLCIILMMMSAGCRKASTNDPDIATDLPDEQKQFCQIMSKSSLNDAIASLGRSGTFTAWRGQGSIHLRSDGKTLGITFSPTCPDSNASVTLEDVTGVPSSSSLGHTLQGSDYSHGMIISGKLSRPSASGGGASSLVAQLQLISPVRFSQPSQTAQRGGSSSAHASTTSRPSPRSRLPATVPISAVAHSSGKGVPDQQSQLCNLFAEFDRYKPPYQDPNPIKQATAPPLREPDWNAKMHAIMGDSGVFTDWKGEADFSVNQSYKPARINLSVSVPSFGRPCAILMTDQGNGWGWGSGSHINTNTAPIVGSDISNVLSTMNQQHQPVTVSGAMFYWKGMYLPSSYGQKDLYEQIWGVVRYDSEPSGIVRYVVIPGGRRFVVRIDKIAKQ